MRKNEKKQRKSMILSTAVVIAGCLATAIYVDQTMNSTTEYKIDLAGLNVENEGGTSMANDPELNGGASLARVSGHDVVNELPSEQEETPSEQKETEGNEKNSTEKKDDGIQIEQEDRISEEKENLVQEDMEKNNVEDEQPEDLQSEAEESDSEQPDDEQPESKETASASVVTEKSSGLSFSPEDGIGWPVIGDVILNYSMDSAVYFSTLEQYKYNPAILIGAKQGDAVSAVARGQVVKIGENNEIGTYVVMNLGNEYEVTYGQLENLQVEEGSVVARGQVIGNVAKTTKYYSLEGEHAYLMLTKEGEPMDPLSVLQ